jgi:hypothetical protein
LTALHTVPRVDTRHRAISGELLDALIEAVVFPPHPRARSGLICSVMQEICAAVAWRQEGDALDQAAHEELAGIQRLVDAAHDHHRRMAAFGLKHEDIR